MQSRSRASVAILLALAAVSIAARVVLLLERPLWHDEIYTVWAARLAPGDLVAALRVDSGPPLFYLLERPLVLAGEAAHRDSLARLLPFLAGLCLFAAARALPRGAARRWWIGLTASFALVNLYAAEARAYEVLCVLGLAIFLLAARGRESPGRLVGLTAVAAAALWMHYLALIAIAAALALAVAVRRWRSALALCAALGLFAPWMPILASQPREAMAWLLDSPARSLEGFVSALGGVGRIPAPFGPALPAAIPLVGLLVGVLLAALVLRATGEDPEGRLALGFVLLVLAMALAASLWHPVAFAGRSEMAGMGVWLWVVSRAATRSRPTRSAATAAAALGLAATLFVARGPHPRSTPASAVESVARLAHPGDVVLTGPGFYLPFGLAAERGRLAARVESLPARDAVHPGWFIAWPLTRQDVADTLRIADGLPGGARLFLLLPPPYSSAPLMGPLGERGTLRELVRQDDGVLTVWTPRR